MRAARSAVACVAAAWLAACGLGLNGLEGSAGEGGAGGLDATADVTSVDGGSDTGVGTDATSGDTGTTGADTGPVGDTGTAGDVVAIEASPADGCVATGPESCTNGVDDDCNGLVDCADPACTNQGYKCVPKPTDPAWSIVAFDPASQPACPAGLMQKTGSVDPTSLPPAVCGCTCGAGTNPSCDTGNMVGKGGPDNTCATPPANFPANGGACVNNMLPVTAYVQVTLPGPTGGTCTATPSVTKPSTGATSGEYCIGESMFGAGCSGTDVCALVPTGYQACAQHGGANMACNQPGYPTAHAIGALQDTRGCANCTCGAPTATCSGTWNFYSSMNCTGAVGISATANGACDATNNPNVASMFQSYMVVAPPTNVACAAPAPPAPTGSVMLTGADTICCE